MKCNVHQLGQLTSAGTDFCSLQKRDGEDGCELTAIIGATSTAYVVIRFESLVEWLMSHEAQTLRDLAMQNDARQQLPQPANVLHTTS